MGLFSLIGRLSLNTSEFDAGLKKAESTAKTAGSAIRNTLGAVVSVAAVAGAARSIGQWTDNVLNLADAYELTTTQVQKASGAAMMNGVSVEQLLASTVKLNDARQKALEGDTNSIRNFATLGVSLQDLQSKQRESFDLTIQVAEAMAAGANKIESQAAATDILGTRSIRLAQALRDINKESPLVIIEDEQLRKLDETFDKSEVFFENLKRYGAGILSLGVERFEKSAQNTSPKLGPLAGISSLMDMATEFIANAFGSSVFTPENVRHAALSLPEKVADSLFPDGYTREGRATGEQFGPDVAPVAAKQKGFNPFMSGVDTTRIGGLYFGSQQYNQQVLSELKEQVRSLKQISTATKVTAEVIARDQ